MKRNILYMILVFFLVLLLVFVLLLHSSMAETLYVTADGLNGRASPSKRGSVEAYFDEGDELEPTGAIDGKWVEVYGGETGTVWCYSDYLSEIKKPVTFKNISHGRVRIRENPTKESSKHVGWVGSHDVITVSRVINGWGYIKNKGWVDLSFFEQIS